MLRLKEKGQFSALRRAHTNQEFSTKLGTFDYLVHTTKLAKFGYDRMGGVDWA
jgi:hypothetical protein